TRNKASVVSERRHRTRRERRNDRLNDASKCVAAAVDPAIKDGHGSGASRRIHRTSWVDGIEWRRIRKVVDAIWAEGSNGTERACRLSHSVRSERHLQSRGSARQERRISDLTRCLHEVVSERQSDGGALTVCESAIK